MEEEVGADPARPPDMFFVGEGEVRLWLRSDVPAPSSTNIRRLKIDIPSNLSGKLLQTEASLLGNPLVFRQK